MSSRRMTLLVWRNQLYDNFWYLRRTVSAASLRGVVSESASEGGGVPAYHLLI